MAVMGVNAIELGAVSAPPLTSVSFDAKAIVDVAVAAMMSELGYPADQEPSNAAVATLIARDST
jgi:DNA-binding LacI/PurR family transcriptional regulator